jgi:LacI family transcriptional regulator
MLYALSIWRLFWLAYALHSQQMKSLDSISPAETARIATATEVAKLAGVSTATVSRVFNKVGNISANRVDRVLAAASQLGYVPHAAARTLASRRSRLVGAIIPTIENPNFGRAIEALQGILTDNGYTLLLGSSGYDGQKESQQVRALVSQGVDAIVWVGNLHQPETIEFLHRYKVPFVNIWVNDSKYPCIGFDNRDAGQIVANYLLDLGHRNIGVIAGVTRNNDRASLRVSGIRDALEKRGVALPNEMLIERPYRIIEGQMGFRALMESRPTPTAIICGNDILAFGALLEAGRLGFSVPADMSIAGFDDLEFSGALSPSLTTIRIDAEQIGIRTAEHILRLMAGMPVARSTTIPISLIVRGSTAPPAQRAS